jgi:uncharacterized protein YjbI with pentapeptide repeats
LPGPESDGGTVPLRTTRLDLQAAVTVIGRRNTAITQRIDLTGADLSGAILTGAELSHADLRSTDLSGADLAGVNLAHANLAETKLVGANLSPLFRRITSSDPDADLELTPSQLKRAKIRSASGGIRIFFLAVSVTITNYLIRTDLRGADLTGADLTGADLTGADLTGAKWSEATPTPEGWKLDTKFGRLERAGTDSGPAKAN